jgi:hypothetical protein
MKQRFIFCAVSLALAFSASADPLKKEHISPDAKWLVHLDCENLRQTQVGAFLWDKLLGPKLAEMAGELNFNVSNVVERIGSLTAYGSEFTKGADANGVLLINSDAETQKALEGLLVAQILADTNGPVKKLEGDTTIYSVADQVFVSPFKGGPVVVSKSRTELDAARARLAGKAPAVSPNQAFTTFPAVTNSFFFLAVAELFDLTKGVPAQAKVLQMAEGGRVALGERTERVFLDLTLRGKTAEVSQQIQQVVEGMVALVSLGQPNIPELLDLAKSTKVSARDQLVSINLDYPSDKLIARIDQELSPKPKANKAGKAKNKAKAKQKESKPKPEPVEPEEDTDDPAPDGEDK